jgi:DNA-binding GntR family transcriptional regulator
MSRAPLYEQIADDLRKRILAAEFGDTLPSQERLCQLLDVSRSTIREAVRMLELEGLIRAQQGRPTVVQTSGPHFDPGLEELSSTSGLLAAAGSVVGTASLTVSEVDNTPDGPYSEVPSARLLKIERVRTADGVPVVHSTDVVAWGAGDKAQLEAELREGSLVKWLLARDRRVAYARTSLSAKTATAGEAADLGVVKGAALMILDECGFDPNNQVVYCSRDLYRPEIVRFHVIRKPTKW